MSLGEPLGSLIAELNNKGVVKFESNKLEEAESLFIDAIALLNSLAVPARLAEVKGVDQGKDCHQRVSKHKSNSFLTVTKKQDFPGRPLHFEPQMVMKAIRIRVEETEKQGDRAMLVVVLYNMGLLRFLGGLKEEATTFFLMALSSASPCVDVLPTCAKVSIESLFGLALIDYMYQREKEAMQKLILAVRLGSDLLNQGYESFASAFVGIGQILISFGYLREASVVYRAASLIYNLYPIGHSIRYLMLQHLEGAGAA